PQGTLGELGVRMERNVRAALDDDLNAPQALAHLFDFVRAANREIDAGAGGAPVAQASLEQVMDVLDVLPTRKAVAADLSVWVEEQVAARTKARQSRDFTEADRIRTALKEKGVEIEDTPGGTKWKAG